MEQGYAITTESEFGKDSKIGWAVSAPLARLVEVRNSINSSFRAGHVSRFGATEATPRARFLKRHLLFFWL